MSYEYLVDEAVVCCFISRHEEISIRILVNALLGLARVLDQYTLYELPVSDNLLGCDLNIRCLPLRTTQGLMNHETSIGEGIPLSLCSGR